MDRRCWDWRRGVRSSESRCRGGGARVSRENRRAGYGLRRRRGLCRPEKPGRGEVRETAAREAVWMGGGNLAQRLAASCGHWESAAVRQRARMRVSRARRDLVKEERARSNAAAKKVDEKMDRGGTERCGAEVSGFAAEANLARGAARQVARARQRKVARDPSGSLMVAEAWQQLRWLGNFRVFGGGSGERLRRGFP